jgi:hypothetical protein
MVLTVLKFSARLKALASSTTFATSVKVKTRKRQKYQPLKLMILVGRITKDAVVNQLQYERQVGRFNFGYQYYYKPKNGEGKNIANHIHCSYWMNATLAGRNRLK